MKSNKRLQEKDFKVEIGLDNPEDLLREDTAKIDSFFQSHIAGRSPQRVIKNALLAVQYKLELS
jgi:hypothetical protein